MSSQALSQLIGAVTTTGPERAVPPGTPSPADARRRLAVLGSREHEVARAVGHGLTNAEIASTHCLSVPTVKSHISHILAKLDLNNRVQIALLVYRAGLV